ncbi:hypothetical protein P9112_009538 [Eukaryota sp. TZLM1-RC]
MHLHTNPTVITVAQTSNPGRVAPILRSADRSSCSRFVDELRDFAVRMSLMRPEPAPTNSQNSRRSSRNPAPEPAEEAEEEVNLEEIRFNLHEALAEDSPVDQEEEEEAPLLYSDNSDVSDEEKPNPLCLVGAQDPDDLESLLLPYIPRCIAPEVLDTFLVIHQISPKKPKKILKYLLSCTRVKDTAKAYQMFNRVSLPLNCRDADEAITRYTRDFMKVARKVPSLQKEEALSRRYLSGIRPESLKRLLKTEAEDGLITSIPEVISRLKELLPDYHRPYSRNAYLFEDKLAQKYQNPRERRARPTRNSFSTPKRGSRTQAFRPDSRSTQPRTRTPKSNQSHELICNYCKKSGHVVRDCPDPNCKLSQVNKKKPYKNPHNPTLPRTYQTRSNKPINSIVESITEGLKEDYQQEATYVPRMLTHSSSSDSEDLNYSVSLNPFSEINPSPYSESDTHSTPSSSHSFHTNPEANDLDELFESLDFVTPGQDLTYVAPNPIAQLSTPSHSAFCARNEDLKSSRAAVEQNGKVRDCSAIEVRNLSDLTPSENSKADEDAELSNQRKAQGEAIHDFSLDGVSSNLDSDMAPIGADCVSRPGEVMVDLDAEDSQQSSEPEMLNTLYAAKVTSPAPTCHVIPDRSRISFTYQELNKPMDKSLLHLKAYTKNHDILYGMVDTGASVSCISSKLVKNADLTVSDQTTFLSLADGQQLEAKVAKGRFAFMLGGTAHLTYIDMRLCLLPCENNFIIGCDTLKRLGLLNEDYLFINLSHRNLQILEDEAIPDSFLPKPAEIVSQKDLVDDSKSPEFVQSLNDDLLETLPDIEKTAFHLDDTELTINIKRLLLKYPDIFSKLPDPKGIKCRPMRLEFHDETELVSKKARYLPPDKLKIAHEEFDTLLENGFAVPYDGPFASPIHLVCAPGKAPRLTGDYSGHKGINDLTKPVPASTAKDF